MTWSPRPLPALVGAVSLIVAVLLSGCSVGGDEGLPATCGVRILQSAIPDSAPHVGGPGPATVNVKVLDTSDSSLARVPVLAWWLTQDGGVDFVALRTDGLGLATVLAPEGAVVFVASGDGSWTHDGAIVAGQKPALVLLPTMADGFAHGQWTTLVPVGALPVDLAPTRVWQPTDMPWADAAHLSRIVDLHLRLAWTNNRDGIVDLAIGLGTEEDWQQWNQEVQTQQGTFQEELTLDRAALDAAGWLDGDSLLTGPALGTGGFTPDPAGLTYDLRWTARFTLDSTLGDLCARFGDVRLDDVTDGSR